MCICRYFLNNDNNVKISAGPTNPCNPNPCLNGGNCFYTGSTYICRCPAGISGTNCQITGISVVFIV